MIPIVEIPFPGVGLWVIVVLARESTEQMAWIPKSAEIEKGNPFVLEDGSEWTIAFVADFDFEMTGEEGSSEIH